MFWIKTFAILSHHLTPAPSYCSFSKVLRRRNKVFTREMQGLYQRVKEISFSEVEMQGSATCAYFLGTPTDVTSKLDILPHKSQKWTDDANNADEDDDDNNDDDDDNEDDDNDDNEDDDNDDNDEDDEVDEDNEDDNNEHEEPIILRNPFHLIPPINE
jgi:hypothetical protein